VTACLFQLTIKQNLLDAVSLSQPHNDQEHRSKQGLFEYRHGDGLVRGLAVFSQLTILITVRIPCGVCNVDIHPTNKIVVDILAFRTVQLWTWMRTV
jgi:hypothetical protein